MATGLSVNEVWAGYGRGPILRGASLAVPDGKTIALIGPNGAGKTTLLRVISGLLKASQGMVTFGGVDLGQLRPHGIAALGISHVPQGRHVFGGLTVEENVRIGGHRIRNQAQLHARIARLAETFPILSERRRELAKRLSGGQQQMLVIARALVSEPSLLVLDEPSMGLAPIMVSRVGELLATLKAAGQSMLLVEQNLGLALAVADELVLVAQGAVVAVGTPTELRDHPAVREAYLGIHGGAA